MCCRSFRASPRNRSTSPRRGAHRPELPGHGARNRVRGIEPGGESDEIPSVVPSTLPVLAPGLAGARTLSPRLAAPDPLPSGGVRGGGHPGLGEGPHPLTGPNPTGAPASLRGSGRARTPAHRYGAIAARCRSTHAAPVMISPTPKRHTRATASALGGGGPTTLAT